MRVAITATRASATDYQVAALRDELHDADIVDIGDCVGGDAQAYAVARELGCHIVGHPPDNPKHRAFLDYDEEWATMPYLTRNHDMVDVADRLIAMPRTDEEELRSGTWATVRYARAKGVPVTLIVPI